MVQTTFNFNHDTPKVAQALGVNSNTEDKCIEIIIFSTISNFLISEELFDSRDEAPSKLTTMSGDLEKALSLVNTDQERDYVLFMFRQLHMAVQTSIAKKQVLEEMTGMDKKKAELVMKMLELKIEEKAEESEVDSFLTPSSVFNRIRLVEESRYNFDKYLLLLQNNSNESEN